MTELLNLIPTIGFPVIACCGMAWYFRELIKNFMEREEREAERHKEETDKFAESLNNNTIVLQKLCDRLDREDVKL